MTDWIPSIEIQEMITTERAYSVVRALLTLILGLIIARLIGKGVSRLSEGRMTAQSVMLLRRLVFWVLAGLVVATALHQIGFQLTVLLGAAGVLTVAIGFASQTSASNLISGLFLIAERPFVVGDNIRIDDVTGQVLSIDLLSVKIRTFDNLLVRVPNESIIKTRVTNLTAFPIRRADIQVGVAYHEDLEKVQKVLRETAHRNPLCMEEPEPLLIFQGFGDSALQYQFSVWARRENFLVMRTSLQEQIKAAFDREGIEIPFPHRTLYTGSVTEPFPVRVVPEGDEER